MFSRLFKRWRPTETESTPEGMRSNADEATAKKTNREQPASHDAPNELTRAIMVQAKQVDAKTDELSQVVKGLSDITRQLAEAYSANMRKVQGLGVQLETLEGRPL